MNLLKYYLTNENGDRIAVVLPLEEYHSLLDALEELESIQEYDTAIADKDDVIPLEEAIALTERSHFFRQLRPNLPL